jgi:hypothetical protein
MAFAVNAVDITVTMDDDGGSVSTTSVSFDPGDLSTQNWANLTGFADSWAAALAAISDCRVAKYTISIRAADAAATVPADNSNVEKKFVLLCEAQNGITLKYQIPGISDALVDSYDNIDLTQADIATLVNLYVTGDGTLSPTARNGAEILRAAEGYQYHQQSHFQKRRRKG